MTEPIPAILADIHNHLVPGVDDGSRSLDESLRHLRALRAEGVAVLATSSHLSGWMVYDGRLADRLRRLERGFEQLRQACEARPDVPELRFNQEILTPNADVAARVFELPGVGLRGTDYALCELGFDPKGDPAEVVRVVLAAGKRVIIAHPERYRQHGLPWPIERVRALKDAGALLQLNCGSLVGHYGPGHEALGWQLIEEGLADLLGSDNHADAHPVSPREAARALVGRGATEQARLLLSENPLRVLGNQETLTDPALGTEAAA